MTAWNARTLGQKTYAHARAHFEAKVNAIEDFVAVGGQTNTYASANSATELKEVVASALEEFSEQNKENVRAATEVNEAREKLDTLQQAVALLS